MFPILTVQCTSVNLLVLPFAIYRVRPNCEVITSRKWGTVGLKYVDLVESLHVKLQYPYST